MKRFTIQQRVEIVKNYYQNGSFVLPQCRAYKFSDWVMEQFEVGPAFNRNIIFSDDVLFHT